MDNKKFTNEELTKENSENNIEDKKSKTISDNTLIKLLIITLLIQFLTLGSVVNLLRILNKNSINMDPLENFQNETFEYNQLYEEKLLTTINNAKKEVLLAIQETPVHQDNQIQETQVNQDNQSENLLESQNNMSLEDNSQKDNNVDYQHIENQIKSWTSYLNDKLEKTIEYIDKKVNNN